MPTNKQLIERWQNVERVLKALTPHQRKKHWDMSMWGDKTECGTVACAAGHCGLDPWFRRRGFKMNFYSLHLFGHRVWDVEIDGVEAFFGAEGTNAIFYDETQRPVSQVIREVRAHIKRLQQQE